MVFLWAVPPALLILGAAAICVLAVRAGTLRAAVRDELEQFSDVRVAVARVQAEAQVARSRLSSLDDR